MAQNNPHDSSTQASQSNQITCQQCQFMQSCKLSQQIVQLREKLLFYQNKNKQMKLFTQKSEQQQYDILKNYQQLMQNQIKNELQSENDQDITKLQNQLQQLERQLQKEQNQVQLITQERSQIIEQLISIENSHQNSLKQYNHLLSNLDQMSRKQANLKSLKSLFQRTNFINIIYSISFEDNQSFLNGQKITHENSWKIIQIFVFYQEKYKDQYIPVIKIDWDQMQISPYEQKMQESLDVDIIKSTPIQVNCDNAKNVMQIWVQYLVLQMKSLFEFMVKESGKNTKLKYQVTKQGEFTQLKDKIFNNDEQKFDFVLKYLLIDIDQINQLQFFAKQRRVEELINEEKQQAMFCI